MSVTPHLRGLRERAPLHCLFKLSLVCALPREMLHCCAHHPVLSPCLIQGSYMFYIASSFRLQYSDGQPNPMVLFDSLPTPAQGWAPVAMLDVHTELNPGPADIEVTICAATHSQGRCSCLGPVTPAPRPDPLEGREKRLFPLWVRCSPL